MHGVAGGAGKTKLRKIMKQLKKLQVNNYQVRYEQIDGSTYIVVPVVMMREGVHCGSAGAVYHTAEELGKDIHKWIGIPVTVLHPKDGDMFISANSPGVQVVGRVYNVLMDGDKLKGEAWLNEQKLIAVSAQAAEHIKAQLPMDVSVGVYSEDMAVPGEWNGEAYEAVAANYHPDHLALLPGEEGACSWADGCGIRANQKQEVEITNEEENVELTPQTNSISNEQTIEMENKQCELIAKIIQSNSNAFVEADREFLSSLPEEQLEKFHPTQVTEKDVADYIASLDDEKVLNLLPEAIQANVRSGLEARAAKRAELIGQITTNSKDIWTQEELEGMPCAMLDKLSKAVSPTDYSANGGNPTPVIGEEPLLPVGVKKQ
jgi:hypothetical protein